MIEVSILYPNSEGSRFDLDYYCTKHMPMSIRLLGEALRGVTVEQGLSGGLPGSKAAYVAIARLRFDSTEAFYAAFVPHAEVLQGDIQNYTDVEPVIQISDIKICR
ncbi:MAG: EthD family reductase [Nitrospirae bacterium]|nr:EthD family reductase [Nitrospirota bacterium]